MVDASGTLRPLSKRAPHLTQKLRSSESLTNPQLAHFLMVREKQSSLLIVAIRVWPLPHGRGVKVLESLDLGHEILGICREDLDSLVECLLGRE